MSVDGLMVLVKRGLPFSGLFILELGSSLPGRQGCTTLPPPEVWFIARCVWCACIAADIEHRDPVKVFVSQALVQVLVLCSMSRFCPRFPDCSNLNYDLDCNASVFGQGHQASNQCSSFGLRAVWHSCDGTPRADCVGHRWRGWHRG